MVFYDITSMYTTVSIVIAVTYISVHSSCNQHSDSCYTISAFIIAALIYYHSICGFFLFNFTHLFSSSK